jgi:hypothetical protein
MKGLKFTQALMNISPNINWIPIINMSSFEISNLMKFSKIYIDFGNHPGKDRIPREAAICGCCIITNKKGSASNQFDVEIPDTYKFDNEMEHLEEITLLIKDILDNFEIHSSNYVNYRMKISTEKVVFKNCTKEIFSELN